MRDFFGAKITPITGRLFTMSAMLIVKSLLLATNSLVPSIGSIKIKTSAALTASPLDTASSAITQTPGSSPASSLIRNASMRSSASVTGERSIFSRAIISDRERTSKAICPAATARWAKRSAIESLSRLELSKYRVPRLIVSCVFISCLGACFTRFANF